MINPSDKYIFPKHCYIDDLKKAIPETSLKKEEITNQYIIFNKSTKSIFTINESIKNFLDLFINPKSLGEVLKEIKNSSETTEETDKAIKNFLQLMVKRRFLVPLDSNSELNQKELIAFDGFVIVETLKKSNYETVSLARKTGENVKVILKFLTFNTNATDELKVKRRSYFKKEFEIMRELQEHSLICPLQVYDEKKDLAVVEYIEGSTLKGVIQNGKLTISEKVVIIHQIIEVLSFVHSKGIIHGDIHANQFLIDLNLKIHLIDFGLSYFNDKAQKQVIRRGGIYTYLEPENITSNAFSNVSEYTPSFRSEVYRIGVLIYFLVYEVYPFESFSWRRLCTLIKTEPIKLVSSTSRGEKIPLAILVMLERSLAKDASLRFDSALAMKKYLKTTTV